MLSKWFPLLSSWRGLCVDKTEHKVICIQVMEVATGSVMEGQQSSALGVSPGFCSGVSSSDKTCDSTFSSPPRIN